MALPLTDNEIRALLDDPELTATQLGMLSDEYWDVKQRRLAADKSAAALKTVEAEMEAKLIEQMLKQQISAVGGGSVIFTLPSPKMEPAVTDWQAFWKFIKDMDDMSLFEKRPGRAAIKERWEAGQTIPGVEKFPVYKLSKQGVK